MKNKNFRSLLIVFVTFTVGINFLPLTIANASNINKRIQRTTTFVGGDLHTLTSTKNGLFVTGHEAGSRSTNEGLTWKSITSFKGVDIMSWATTDLGYLAGGHNGLFKSTDGGKSFTRLSFYGKTSDVHALGAARRNVYMGSPQVGFLRSIDSGKSWKVINQKFGQGLMGSMLVDSANPLRVIALDMNNGLVVTHDGGKSWSRFGGPQNVMSIDWNPKNQKEIVALGMESGALTNDNGKTWTAFPVPMNSSAIAFSSTGSKIFVAILASNKAEILSSADGGKSWT